MQFLAGMMLWIGEPMNVGERALGLFHLLAGIWLMYLTWAVGLTLAAGIKVPN